MTTPHSKQKLAQAEDIAHAIGAGQPELGVPCLDLVTVFEVSAHMAARMHYIL